MVRPTAKYLGSGSGKVAVLAASALSLAVGCGGVVRSSDGPSDANAGNVEAEMGDSTANTSESGFGSGSDATIQASRGDSSGEDSDSGVDASTEAGGDMSSGNEGGSDVASGDGAGEGGACIPYDTECVDGGVQACGSDGQWGEAGACSTDTPLCLNGACLAPSLDGGAATPLSCQPGGPGMSNCGPGGSGNQSCCASLEVPGGTYYRTYEADGGGATGEADLATVSGFRLDKYLVTVGRFRQFVNAVIPPDGGAGWMPSAGSGKHGHLNGGLGLAAGPNLDAGQTYDPGWVTSDDSAIAPTNTNLTTACGSSWWATWTNSVGSQENLPSNCANWYEAYAFCIWDGGFLPSEAEWEFAAAGGSLQREYPWGSTDPTNNQYAIFGCNYPIGPGMLGCASLSNIAPVGTAGLGAGAWGQLDLAGELFEWNQDWNADYVDPWTDCANLSPASNRAARGGLFNITSMFFLRRNAAPPTMRDYGFGFRCARTP